jgi:hypothetical protein
MGLVEWGLEAVQETSQPAEVTAADMSVAAAAYVQLLKPSAKATEHMCSCCHMIWLLASWWWWHKAGPATVLYIAVHAFACVHVGPECGAAVALTIRQGLLVMWRF